MNKTPTPMMYPVANALILNKIKSAIGLDQAWLLSFGAAPMKKSTILYFASLDIPLMNMYGMSETTGAATMMSVEKFRQDTAGFAVHGT